MGVKRKFVKFEIDNLYNFATAIHAYGMLMINIVIQFV